jgi:predicted RND superfamily exporter protein
MSEDTVLPTRGMQSVPYMNAIGYLMAAGVALALLPILPLLAVLYLLGQRWSSAPEPRFERPAAE